MSFLKDVLGFESFALKDMWKTIKKDPERLLLGALDPFSTRIWNQTGIGKNWEPVVDQFGGPYSGNSLGGGTEGVYGRAQAAGVPTEAGGQMHELARTIASLYAGGYGAGKLGGAMGLDKIQGGKIPGGFRIPGGGMKGGGRQAPPPMPFIKSQQQGFLPVGEQDQLSQLLSRRGPQNNQGLAILAALLRSQNG